MENARPLQPRVRGLPGNTAGTSRRDEKVGEARLGSLGSLGRQASTGSEKRLRQPSPEAAVVPFSSPPSVVVAVSGTSSAASVGGHRPGSDAAVQAAAMQVSLRDLAELRSFRNPPAVVCQVLEAVALVLGEPDSRWASMRKLLDNNFHARLCSFDPASIAEPQKERLRMLLQVPTFSDGSLSERCPAVAALAEWCNTVGRHLEWASIVMRTGSGEGLGSSLASPRSHATTEVMSVQRDLGGLVVEPDLWQLSEDDLIHVENLTVSREGVGSVTFHGATDCRQLVRTLTDVVVLNPGEVVIYPNQKVKPPVGYDLNKPASITLYGCHPKTQSFRDNRAREKYKNRVRAMTEEKGAEFVDYDCDHGVWQFRVAHF